MVGSHDLGEQSVKQLQYRFGVGDILQRTPYLLQYGTIQVCERH
jgi:hypothetical protein